MKRLFQWVALATIGLLLFSCEKSDPSNNGGQSNIKELVEYSDLQRFEMSSSLSSVSIEGLSSNTDKVSKDQPRATLHFNGLDQSATTTLKAEDFGATKRQARWGVIYDGGQYYALNCDDAESTEPNDPINNTVFFRGTTTNNTIQDAEIRMYCRSLKNLKNVTKGFMVLEGEAGDEPNSTKQYFTSEKGTAPNHRLEPLMINEFQDDRHIPIMTKLENFAEIIRPLGSGNYVRLGPRGSLIGLSIKNSLSEDIIITHILVEKSGALDYSGYFDWGNPLGNTARFIPEYSTTSPTLEFPVYANETASDIGYTLAQNTTNLPCFYIWGFQNPNKLGKDFQVKIRYKTTASSGSSVTYPFAINAPNSILVSSTKQFDDGYAYNTVLTISPSNSVGGAANVNDWNYGGSLSNNSNPGPSVGGRTPLDYVAEEFAINKAGTGFVKNGNLPQTNVYADINDDEVGYYTFGDAKSLFEKPWLKNSKYFFPNVYHWKSIVPYYDPYHYYVIFDQKTSNTHAYRQEALVGEESVEDDAVYTTVQEGSLYVTYALRFRGTKWYSAWRYSYEGNEGNKKMIIKCVALKDTPNGNLLSLEQDIANPEFFTVNPCTIRTFLSYGYNHHYSHNNKEEIRLIGENGCHWSSSPFIINADPSIPPEGAVYMGFNIGHSCVLHHSQIDENIERYPVRPFVHLE